MPFKPASPGKEGGAPPVAALLFLAQVCFATMPVAGRAAVETVRPASVVLVRALFGALVFWAVALRGGVPSLTGRDLARAFACGLLGVALNQTLFVSGLAHTTAANASVVGASVPVLTAVLAVVLGHERPSPRRAAGVVVALAGALILARIDRLDLASDHAVGTLLVLGSAASYSLFLVIVRPLGARHAPAVVAALVFSAAVPPLAAIELAPLLADLSRYGVREVLLLAFIVAVPTVAAYGLNQVALARAEPSRVALWIYLQPVLATALAYPLLGEAPTARTAAAAALVFAGVWLGARPAPARGSR